MEEAVLVTVEQHQTRRPQRRDLSAELRSNRSAGAGDDNPLALKESSDGGNVQTHRFARQEILDLQLTSLLELDSLADQFMQPRNDRDPNPVRFDRSDDLTESLA